MNPDAIAQGVADSFDFWLSQHDVTVPDTIEAAVSGAVQVWLDANTAPLVEAIARAVAEQQGPQP